MPSLRMAMFSVRLTSPRICVSPVGREDEAAESDKTKVKELSTVRDEKLIQSNEETCVPFALHMCLTTPIALS